MAEWNVPNALLVDCVKCWHQPCLTMTKPVLLIISLIATLAQSHWMIMQKLIFGLRISVARHMPSNAVTTRLTRLRLRQQKRNNQA